MFQRALALEQAQEGEAGYSKLTRKYEGQPSPKNDGCPSVSICEGLFVARRSHPFETRDLAPSILARLQPILWSPQR